VARLTRSALQAGSLASVAYGKTDVSNYLDCPSVQAETFNSDDVISSKEKKFGAQFGAHPGQIP
jgi:hypothetical protein